MLGVAGNLGYLCSNVHGRINPWAKYKPLAWGKVTYRNSDWWKGPDGLCGLDINSNHIYGAISTFLSAARNNQIKSWNYLAPQAGTDWFRLLDFNGYNHNAVPPLNKLVNTNITVYPSTGILTVQYNANTSDTSSIQLQDIRIPVVGMETKDMYAGALVYDNVSYLAGTDNKRLQEYFVAGDNVIGIPLSGYTFQGTRTWNVVPFLCTAQFSGNSLPSSGTIIPIPMAFGQITVTLRVSSVRIYNYGYFLSSDMSKLYYGFTILNGTGSTVTTGEITTVLLNANQDQISRVVTVPSQTIAAGASFQYTDKVLNNVSGDVSYNARYIRTYYGKYDAMVEAISPVTVEDTIP